jgi:hypothetical protein
MKNIKYFIGVLVVILSVVTNISAQCPMCRMTAESNMQNGGTSGAGLNAGILYMLVIPYLLVGGVAYWWWKNKKKAEEEEEVVEGMMSSQNDSIWN